MNNAIDNNRAAIEKLNKDLVYAQVAVGVGIFMLVAGVALTVATAGTAAAVSGGIAAVGAASIIAGGVTWGVLQNQIDDDYDSIAQEQKQKLKINNRLSLYRGFPMPVAPLFQRLKHRHQYYLILKQRGLSLATS